MRTGPPPNFGETRDALLLMAGTTPISFNRDKIFIRKWEI